VHAGDLKLALREADVTLALRDAAIHLDPENDNLLYQQAQALATG